MEAAVATFVVIWIAGAIVVGNMGSERKIGFVPVFLVSIFLSPVVGALVALASDKIPASPSMALFKGNANTYFASAANKAHRGLYADAIADLLQAVAIDPKLNRAYFNLACLSCRLKKKEDAFRYLALAVENGYSNFANISADKDLDYIRCMPEFPEFVASGYRAPVSGSSLTDVSSDLIEKLERLGALRENGVLTEQEFQSQKSRLLSS